MFILNQYPVSNQVYQQQSFYRAGHCNDGSFQIAFASTLVVYGWCMQGSPTLPTSTHSSYRNMNQELQTRYILQSQIKQFTQQFILKSKSIAFKLDLILLSKELIATETFYHTKQMSRRLNKNYDSKPQIYSQRDRSRNLQRNNHNKHSSSKCKNPYQKKLSQHPIYWSRQNPSNQNFQNTKIIRQLTQVKIENPQVFLVWKYPKGLSKQKTISFKRKIIKLSAPPAKIEPQSSRLSELKNQISPVEQVWSQMIKQYLNDSEFVEIYRKNNSLAYGQEKYGKTIIKYDGDKQKKYYGNQQSQYNIFSRAYFKLWQILSLGILSKKRQQDIVIANLAEGPGGFIHSLIDFRLKQNKTLKDRYYAITLKIQQGKTRLAKDWQQPRAKAFFQMLNSEGYNIKLSYGQTGNGNLYDLRNIDSFKMHVMEGKEAFLVTADGGIQCIGDQEFHYQQIFNAKLFLSEILTALRIQQRGGTFILKIYDIHFEITSQLIILLCIFYRKVGLIKPLTSRPGNSQKYVLCEDFYGVSEEQIQILSQLLKQWHETQKQLSYFQNKQYLHSILEFKKQHINQFQTTIRQRITIINTKLSQQQETKVEEGLKLIKRHQGDRLRIKNQIKSQRIQYQISYAYQWCQKYGLKTIDVNNDEIQGQILHPPESEPIKQKKETKT